MILIYIDLIQNLYCCFKLQSRTANQFWIKPQEKERKKIISFHVIFLIIIIEFSFFLHRLNTNFNFQNIPSSPRTGTQTNHNCAWSVSPKGNIACASKRTLSSHAISSKWDRFEPYSYFKIDLQTQCSVFFFLERNTMLYLK